MSQPCKILFTDVPWGDVEIERGILNGAGADLVCAPQDDEATLTTLARDVQAIATCWAQVTAGVIQAAADLRLVARMGIGLDNIAVDAATARGVPVTNVPDYCVDEVAEHTLALLLACARNVAFFHLRTKRGEYDLQAGPPMRRLAGQTLGLVGFGRIGQAVYHKARGLGLNVVASTPSGRDYGTGCRMVSLEELCRISDFVSLHAPATDATRHTFDALAFTWLQPTAILINTSRGALVDQAALWQALEHNQLAGAALDVFDPEPPDLSQPLFRDERVIVTPHAAFVSDEALRDLRTRVARQIVAVLAGQQPENVVNPQVYPNR